MDRKTLLLIDKTLRYVFIGLLGFVIIFGLLGLQVFRQLRWSEQIAIAHVFDWVVEENIESYVDLKSMYAPKSFVIREHEWTFSDRKIVWVGISDDNEVGAVFHIQKGIQLGRYFIPMHLSKKGLKPHELILRGPNGLMQSFIQ